MKQSIAPITLVLLLVAGRVAADCDRSPLNPPNSAKRNLDQTATDWGAHCEGAPTWAIQGVSSPSLDGSALQLSLTGGSAAGYGNAYFYRNLTSEPQSTSFTMTESFRFPSTTFNNEGAPSLVQGLEFSMSKYLAGRRWEWALQWENVGADGAPGWRYWSGTAWVGLNIPDRLAPNQWHSLTLNGEIVDGQVRYQSFVIDQRNYAMGQTVSPVATPDADQLTVAVQLDANAHQDPYAVLVDQVNLAGWARTCGDGRVDRIIDSMDDVSKWQVCCTDRNRAAVTLRSVPGCSGSALAIDYDLNGAYPSGADWLVIQRQFDPPLDLSAFSHLRVAVTGANINAHHNVQFKLADQSNNVDWYIGQSVADLPAWRTIYVDLRQLTCFSGGAPCAVRPLLDLAHIARIEIAAARCLQDVSGTTSECESGSQNANVLSIDELAGVDLRPGAAFRLGSAARERVTPNDTVRAAAARSLRDKQERSGLVPAWYEEGIANYNTYAEALRILVMVREYELTGDDMYRQAAERTLAAMLALQRVAGTPNSGAWFTAFEWDGTRMIPRDGCQGTESATSDIDRCFWVGNTAWMLIALDRVRSGLPGDHTAVNTAMDRAADWIAGKMGRLSDVPDVVTYGLEGNISAYFGLLAARRTSDAARLGAAVFQFGWDPTEQRMKIGVLTTQMGSAMDTAGSWGAYLLRSLGKETEARASQSYIASMFRTSSFDGKKEGYGDVEGPWTTTVEFGAQGVEAGIPGADHVMSDIVSLQAPDGSFPGGSDDFLGGSAWITTWHGVAPTAWVYFANAGGPLPALSQTPFLSTASASPSSLSFRQVKSGNTLRYSTPAQTLTLALDVAGTVTWTAAGDQPWVTVSPTSGSGSATLIVSATETGNSSGSFTGLVTIRTAGATNAVLTANVHLTVDSSGAISPAFGAFDTPVGGPTVLAGSFAVTGWALDDVAIDRVEIWRDRVAGETTPVYPGPGPGTGKIFIANPLFINGARPDVEAAYRNNPFAPRAGWGYLLLSWGLWNQGNGPFTLYAFAYDQEGNATTLGTKTITVDNAHATKPFGGIDTPSYGQTVSGAAFNFGWALTPDATPSCTIGPGGVQVGIDSGPLAAVTYGGNRTDIAAAFPGFTNGAAAGGAYFLDTTLLTNGTHSIGWLVTDSCGRVDGIGSRFFTVLNGGSAVPASDGASSVARATTDVVVRGPAVDVTTAPVTVRRSSGVVETQAPTLSGPRVVAIGQAERVEVELPWAGGATYTGSHVVNGVRRALPLGSSLDAAAGIFYWQPAAGFLGAFDLEFTAGETSVVPVRVVVGPSVRMVVDTPQADAVASQPFLVAGWAIDLAATAGTGIDTVHVWAYPAGGGAPIFLGVAAYGDARPDVAVIYGERFTGAAYNLMVHQQLSPGIYDIVVYPHRADTGAFEGAHSVRIAVGP